jgi:hypothetical protein
MYRAIRRAEKEVDEIWSWWALSQPKPNTIQWLRHIQNNHSNSRVREASKRLSNELWKFRKFYEPLTTVLSVLSSYMESNATGSHVFAPRRSLHSKEVDRGRRQSKVAIKKFGNGQVYLKGLQFIRKKFWGILQQLIPILRKIMKTYTSPEVEGDIARRTVKRFEAVLKFLDSVIGDFKNFQRLLLR